MNLPVGWSSLERLASTRPVSSTYIWLLVVPIISKLMASAPDSASFNVLGQPMTIDLRLPFSWEAFFFAALSFTVANLVFVLKCPKIIKDHRTAAHFRSAGKGWGQLLDYRAEAGFDEKDFFKIHRLLVKGEALSEEDEKKLNPQRRFFPMKQTEGQYNALFFAIHEFAEHSRRLPLWIANILYALGLGLIVSVLVQNLLAVIRVVAH